MKKGFIVEINKKVIGIKGGEGDDYLNTSSVNYYQSFFENNPNAACIFTPKKELFLYNKAFEQLIDCSTIKENGSILTTLFIPAYQKEFEFHFRQSLQGKIQQFEMTIMIKKEQYKLFSISLSPVYIDGTIQYIIANLHNISEKKLLEIVLTHRITLLEMMIKGYPFEEIKENIVHFFKRYFNKKSSIFTLTELMNETDLYHKIIQQKESFLFGKKWVSPIFNEAKKLIGALLVYEPNPPFLHTSCQESIRQITLTISLVIEYFHSQEQLHSLIYQDTLTGLANRRKFDEESNRVFDRACSLCFTLSVMFIDFDRFKEINDTYGHKIGDCFLIEVTKRLKESIPEECLISRFGGDEFVILFENYSKKEIKKIAETIIQSLKGYFLVQNKQLSITPSIGISMFPEHANTLDDLIKKADEAMYHVKKNGGNAFQFSKKTIQ